jgi:hypothetical protein
MVRRKEPKSRRPVKALAPPAAAVCDPDAK